MRTWTAINPSAIRGGIENRAHHFNTRGSAKQEIAAGEGVIRGRGQKRTRALC